MNILFVDDDPIVLRGLERMLYVRRNVWPMHFVASGDSALQLMQNTDIDILISDMRMPGMDGATLLTNVQQQFPATIRIVLSGYSDQDVILRSIRPAHQFLNKPCDQDALIRTIKRASDLLSMPMNSRYRTMASRLGFLPVFSDALMHALNQLRGNAQQNSLAAALTQDVGLTAGVLKLVNTAFFGAGQELVTPDDAIGLLGSEVLLRILSQFTHADDEYVALPFAARALWQHSLRTARFARLIAELDKAPRQTRQISYLAGLFHDLGKVVLAMHDPDYPAVLRSVAASGLPVARCEREHFGITHAEIGAYLLGLWGFDPAVTDIVSRHTSPGTQPHHPALAYVHAANSLDHELVHFGPKHTPHPHDQNFASSAGWADKYASWREHCIRLLDTDTPVLNGKHGARP